MPKPLGKFNSIEVKDFDLIAHDVDAATLSLIG